MNRREGENGSGGLRVVTVGAADAAQRLRRSPEVELVRTDDPLEAVAELARPIDASSPAPAAVIVDPARVTEREREAFVEAARRAAPSVLLLSAGDSPDRAYDGALGPEEGAEEILTRLTRGPDPAWPKPAGAPAESRPAPAAGGRDAGVTTDADVRVLESLVTGRADLEAALAAASLRLGVPARLERSGDAGRGAPVERRGRLFGVLTAEGAGADALAREAARLARVLALEEQLVQLREAAFVDDLTGAWNRGFFRRRLPRVLESARAGRRDLTLMLYDIDDFKQYNDEFGHGAGDEILRETVKLLRSVIRPTDLVCRIGGDEFAVIFDDPRSSTSGTRDVRRPGGHHPRTIAEIAQRFQRQVCEHRFPALTGGARRTLTISGGMATFPWDAGNAEELLESADRLLLESKRRGKNAMTLGPGADRACRVEFIDPDGAGG